MGNPLGPTLANFFLADLETKLFENFGGAKPTGYLRYVDDIFCIFDNPNEVNPFFNFLNKLHKNLKFTLELGTNSLPFLDTEIIIDGVDFKSCIFRKKTHTGVLMNFFANVPSKWKTSLISCLLNRAKCVCSSESYFNMEVANLRKLFCRNSYPISFFNRVLQRFLNKQLVPVLDNNSDAGSDKSSFTLSVPFIGEASIKFSKQISTLIKNTFNVDVLPVFTSCKVGDYFSLKSITPFAYSSNVVYKFSCLRDADRSYIGQTKRHLVTRVGEHVELQKTDPKSEIKTHIYNCAACHNNF